jgi:hypothetical protein
VGIYCHDLSDGRRGLDKSCLKHLGMECTEDISSVAAYRLLPSNSHYIAAYFVIIA